MTTPEDWGWKLREATDRIRTRYEHIGRKTAAPFLAIVYPPQAEREALREWHTLARTLDPPFAVRAVDVLQVTTRVVRQFGVEALVEAMRDPMPGSDPTAELGELWMKAVVSEVHAGAGQGDTGRPVVVLERLAALYPASSPRAVMQALWDSGQSALEAPVILLIPGSLLEARVYAFVGKVQEFMYRGDIL
ncbi:MAG: hypothetical protein HY724_07935 [Candidatus Rokubacteria bacterium]|nr:hypothetical protein [Candidatus Rokubacteria bacterium]